jgi:PAS domain S-box-containing protein
MAWVTDTDRLATFFNDAWLEFVGAALPEHLGWGWMQTIHDDDLPGLLASYEAAQQEQRGFEFVARVRASDGTFWWLITRVVPRTVDGAFAGFVGICEPVGPAASTPRPTPDGVADLLPAHEQEQEPLDRAVERLARLRFALDVARPAETLEGALLRRVVSRWVLQDHRIASRHDDVVLCVGEAVANATLHAYTDQEPGRVRLACELRDANAEVRVRDWGTWLAPRPNRDSRGLGIMEALTDELQVLHHRDGTEIVLRYSLVG